MTWLSKLRLHLGYDEPSSFTPDHVSKAEATQALETAKAALGEARQRREEMRQVHTSLVNLNLRNGYGESIHLAMMPKERRK